MRRNILSILFLLLCGTVFAQGEALYKHFADQHLWQVQRHDYVELNDSVLLPGVRVVAHNSAEWDSLLYCLHLQEWQLGAHAFVWNRTLQRDVRRNAFWNTPSERACLLVLARDSRTAMFLFPANAAEERAATEALKGVYGSHLAYVERREYTYDPQSRTFMEVWTNPIIYWANRVHEFMSGYEAL